MSLDVHLIEGPDPFAISEIKRALVAAFGESRADDLMAAAGIGRESPNDDYEPAFSANITHNLGAIAQEAGIYEACWRPYRLFASPEEKDAMRAKTLDESEFDKRTDVRAKHLIEPLRNGLAVMKADPARFERLNPENGWGNFKGFVRWVEEYLAACEAHPLARVMVSR